MPNLLIGINPMTHFLRVVHLKLYHQGLSVPQATNSKLQRCGTLCQATHNLNLGLKSPTIMILWWSTTIKILVFRLGHTFHHKVMTLLVSNLKENTTLLIHGTRSTITLPSRGRCFQIFMKLMIKHGGIQQPAFGDQLKRNTSMITMWTISKLAVSTRVRIVGR